MSFTDQKPRIATASDVAGRWGSGFRCYLCGHPFVAGDQFRWIYMGGMGVINTLVCKDCDGEDVKERWKRQCEWICKAAFFMRDDTPRLMEKFGALEPNQPTKGPNECNE